MYIIRFDVDLIKFEIDSNSKKITVDDNAGGGAIPLNLTPASYNKARYIDFQNTDHIIMDIPRGGMCTR